MGNNTRAKKPNMIRAIASKVTGKVRDVNERRVDKLANRRDDIFDTLQIIGIENLRILREAQPKASPLEISKMLEKEFVQSFGSAQTNDDKASAIDEYVISILALHNLDDSRADIRRDAIAFLVAKRKLLKFGKNASTVGKTFLALGELALVLAPHAGKVAKVAKGTKFAAGAAKAAKVAGNVKFKKGAGLVLGLGDLAQRKIAAANADRNAIAKARGYVNAIKKLVGTAPATWPNK